MALTASQLNDLVESTLPILNKDNATQAAQTLQDYEVMGRIWKKDKMLFGSGRSIQKSLFLKLKRGAAEHVGLDAKDNVSFSDVLTHMTVNWTHFKWDYGYIIQEMMMNGGAEEIVDELKARRLNSFLDACETLEESFWGAAPAAADLVSPWGINTWTVKNASQGFNGGLPSDFSTMAGVNLTTYPNFKNWTDTYSAFTKDGIVDGIKLAMYKTRFKSPVSEKQFYGDFGQNYRLYANYDTINKIEKVGEGQNENLGMDLNKMGGVTTINGNAFVKVPFLDSADSANTVFGMNFKTFYPFFLKGDFMRETGPEPVADQHSARAIFNDTTYNYICINRRSNFVLYKV